MRGGGERGEGRADQWEDRQVGGAAVVQPVDVAHLVGAVGEFVVLLGGEAIAHRLTDVQPVDQMQLARRRSRPGPTDALVHHPQQLGSSGYLPLCEPELLVELPPQRGLQVLPGLDIAPGRREEPHPTGPFTPDEGNLVPAEDQRPDADLHVAERGHGLWLGHGFSMCCSLRVKRCMWGSRNSGDSSST